MSSSWAKGLILCSHYFTFMAVMFTSHEYDHIHICTHTHTHTHSSDRWPTIHGCSTISPLLYDQTVARCISCVCPNRNATRKEAGSKYGKRLYIKTQDEWNVNCFIKNYHCVWRWRLICTAWIHENVFSLILNILFVWTYLQHINLNLQIWNESYLTNNSWYMPFQNIMCLQWWQTWGQTYWM